MSKVNCDVTVAICSFSDGTRTRSLVSAVQSILDQSTNLHFEIVVVEEGPAPNDEIVALTEKFSIPIKYKFSKKRLGIAMARKIAIFLSSAPLVAFTDDDCVAEKDWLIKITEPFSNPLIVGVGGTTLSARSKSLVARLCDIDKAQRTPIFDKSGHIVCISTVNACFRKSAVAAVNYFHEDYEGYYSLGIFPGFEDFDITQRLREKFNYTSLLHVPEAIVLHKHRETILGRYRQYKYYGTGAYFWTLIHHLPLNALTSGYNLPSKPSLPRFILLFIRFVPYQINKFNECKEKCRIHEKLFFMFIGFVQRLGFYAGCYSMFKKMRSLRLKIPLLASTMGDGYAFRMEEKRRVSALVPYKMKGESVFVFLQKRAKNTPRAPGLFGFFGGEARDAETPEETLLRETKEELHFAPHGFRYFSTYDLPDTILSLFVVRVDDDFEKRIRVLEGDYGRWFGADDFVREQQSITGHLPILDELYEKLSTP